MKTLDLNQTLLRVAVNRFVPYCDFEIDHNNQSIIKPSIEMEYLRVLAEQFNFRFQLIDMGLDFGSKYQNKWNGVVGIVNKSMADFGMCGLSKTLDRLDLVQFSHYTQNEDLRLLTFAPRPVELPWIVFVPFTTLVWVLISLSILVLSILNYWVNRNSKTNSLIKIILENFAITLRQSLALNFNHKSSRIFFGFWMVFSVILSTGYIGVFHSILTLVEYEESIDSIEQLIKALKFDRIELQLLNNSYYVHRICEATAESSELFNEMKNHLHRNNIKYFSKKASIVESIFRWKKDKPPAFFVTKLYYQPLKMIMEGYRELFLTQDQYMSTQMALAFPRNSLLFRSFSKKIQFMNEAGLGEHFIGKTNEIFAKEFKADPVGFVKATYNSDLPELALRRPRPPPEDVRQLLLFDLRTVFYSWLGGIAVSTIVFAIELLIKIKFSNLVIKLGQVFMYFKKLLNFAKA